MYRHDLFYLQQAWKVWLAPVYKQIQTTKSPLGFLTCAEMLMYVTAHCYLVAHKALHLSSELFVQKLHN